MRLFVQTVGLNPAYYLLMPRDHKAATVSHASEQESRPHQITEVFLQTGSPPPPAFSVCWYVKQQGEPEVIQELCAYCVQEVFFYIHTSSTAEPKTTAEQPVDLCCLSFRTVHTPFPALAIYGTVAGEVPGQEQRTVKGSVFWRLKLLVENMLYFLGDQEEEETL